jgi:glutamate N-acetyltransferase/amino-acid N-acetyltransferase
VVVNAGNANVGTGERGVDVAEAMVRVAADTLGVEPARVGVASTGIIGVQLDEEAIVGGVRAAVGSLGPEGGRDFSEAILTSDRGPKRASLEVSLSSGAVVLAAQAKGAGMISPDFATMLCFVETDAAVDHATLERMVRGATAASFERITVDGQLSTSDSLFVFAGGASGHAVAAGSDDERAFTAALDAMFRQLALEIVADGEGATRVGRIGVSGAASAEEAERVARAIANSPLVKTALYGRDPNWGRIAQAAGMALAGEEIEELGAAAIDAEQMAGEAPEADLALRLGRGDAAAHLYFSDLTPDYVRLNSEYTT